MTEKLNPIQKEPVKASPLYGLAARFQIDPAKIVPILKSTVIRPDKNGRQATDEEVAAFCIVANQYDLNPFTREIFAFSGKGGGIVPIVSVDGWSKIVNRTGQFDGCDFEEVCDSAGLPIAITCRMHVKGRDHPVCATERFTECYRETEPWKKWPWRMLRHKAFIQAARYAFGLGGVYDEDEGIEVTCAPLREPVQMPRAVEQPNNGEPQAEAEKPAGGPSPEELFDAALAKLAAAQTEAEIDQAVADAQADGVFWQALELVQAKAAEAKAALAKGKAKKGK